MLDKLSNLYRAIKPKAYFYFTVEIAAEADIENAFVQGQQLGLPLVYGEWAHEGGYHYYPRIEQVKEWLQIARYWLLCPHQPASLLFETNGQFH